MSTRLAPTFRSCTRLCGCGHATAGEVLNRLGFVLTPPIKGRMDLCRYPFKAPNPEVPEATAPARAFADANNLGSCLE